MSDTADDLGRVREEVMEAVNTRVCRYKCGECEYDETAVMSLHTIHYYAHRAWDEMREGPLGPREDAP